MAGLAVIDGDQMYHYKEVGLEYIWLCNGFDYRETSRGRAVRIHKRDELHIAIARSIVTSPVRLRGKEVRFLRSMLNLSQAAFGRLVRHSRGTIARWEGNPEQIIPEATENWLRTVYTKQTEGDAAVCRLIDILTELDELQDYEAAIRETRFKDQEGQGWQESRRAIG